ncbi:monovalent cation/H(+) antiporter subunit G [Micrococcoides hystricis]|uniref:Monovalent cation/H(+) antiporter subunit G n=1 Tax=Micrococcoides hystricis TaxID=1572761 RepID=A0ABV6PCW3_9MICC
MTDAIDLLPDWLAWIIAILMVAGALMSFFAALGMLRFGDVLSRVHAATKPQVPGLMFLLIALAIAVRDWSWLPFLILAWLLQLITVPVSAHMVGRAVYHTGGLSKVKLFRDELGMAIDTEMEQLRKEEKGLGKGPKNS